MKIYKLTLTILTPRNPEEHEDSDIVIDAECGESLVVGREVTAMLDPEEIVALSGEFFWSDDPEVM